MAKLPAGPFVGKSVGGGGGEPFDSYSWIQNRRALVVKALDVWSNDTTLRGIQITYSDDSTSPVSGKPAGKKDRIVFAPGELVTSLTLWGNGHRTRTGHISITTTAGQEWHAGRTNLRDIRAYSMEIGSGLLVGVFGRSGEDIDRLGLIFLRTPVVSVAIEHVTPKTKLEGTSIGIFGVGIDHGAFSNTGEEETKWTFQGSAKRPSIIWYRQRSINTLGPNVEATLKSTLYRVVVVNKVPKWYVGTSTTSPRVIQPKTLSWNESGELEPGKTIGRDADSFQGQLKDSSYDSTVTIKLEDGWTSTYPESGVFSIVAFSDAYVEDANA